MFCDTCHWYTAGEEICPHCGARQSPEEAEELLTAAPAPTPAPVPAQIPAPAPESTPAPIPVQVPEPMPMPLPKPMPMPLPRPVPVPPPQPMPVPSNGNRQAMKALLLILAGVLALVLVLVLSDRARNDTYTYEPGYVYEDNYDDPPEISLEEAQPGDLVWFGSAQWQVLDTDRPDAVLLLLDYVTYRHPDEIDDFLTVSEYSEDTAYYSEAMVYLAGVWFSVEDFGRIADQPFELTPDEMEQYGVEPIEVWDGELVPVRPAIRVNILDIN